ncbi:extracellular solute-binding protein [Entomospira culicis]|uniref:Extracellular solute-binding protein n=1 Tax=Entomospira culicis TaxID=2719989 RepID=A0A968KWZ2_9SPIO|nr:extracellular solute-binding protein [Entomospira culicis]NIZ19308.1 extracellular solute-binding protein [Entomospira culicis]NIZ69787.1 extracellular solute-binding protein [Entomospira culicis]WDI36898.1 extracellular solute-binding protein [Entomospira culicis]WDI38527.1 extracellular solute-binding protein [Entomospira culicis]
MWKYRAFIVLGFMLLVGCTRGENDDALHERELPRSRFSIDAGQPSYHLMDESGVITWYVNIPAFPMKGSGHDLVSKKILLDTKTQIHFLVGDDDQLQLLFASGELPDIITMDNKLHFNEYATKWAVPLNLLADAYDPYFYEVARADSLAWYQQADGNIYGYPSLSSNYDDFFGDNVVMIGGEGLIVRADIYQALGSPDMRTPDGFLAALRGAKAFDANLTAPLVIRGLSKGGSVIDVLLMFLAVPRIVDSQYYEGVFDEEYLRWVNVLREAYQEGLIIDDNFSFNNMHIYDGVAEGKFFALLTSGLFGTTPAIIQNYKRDPQQHYIAVDGPANRNLDPPTMYQMGLAGWTLTYVTQNSQHKERAMQLITYLMTEEGHKTATLGVEGESYFLDDDGLYRFTPEYQQWRARDPLNYQKESAIRELIWLEEGNWKLRYSDTLAPEMKQIFAWTRDKMTPCFALEQTELPFRSAEERVWKHYLQERNEAVVRMIRAPSYAQMLVELEAFRESANSAQGALAVKNQLIRKNIEKLEKMNYPTC